MTRECRNLVAVVVACLALLTVVPGSVAWSFELVIFLGDSLSDPGNHFIATGDSSRPPYQPVPDNSYTIGGHHFSNGKTWAEQLATLLKMPASGKPAFRSPGHFTNYAVGRARARPAAPPFPEFNLPAQVENVLADFGGDVPADALIVIWIGTNDLSDALFAADLTIILAAVQAVADGVNALAAAGARQFLILNMPNLGNTPFVASFGPPVQAVAFGATLFYNANLASVPVLAAPLPPGTQITFFDVFTFFEDLIADPAASGLENVTAPCLRIVGFPADKPICSRPNRYLFWDGTHPTTAAHGLLADAVADSLGP